MKISKEITQTTVSYTVPIDWASTQGTRLGSITIHYDKESHTTNIRFMNFPDQGPAIEDVPALIIALARILEVDREHQERDDQA